MHGGSSNYSLPLPSFLTTTDGSIRPPPPMQYPSMTDYYMQYHAPAPAAASSQMPFPPQARQSEGPVPTTIPGAPSQLPPPQAIRIMEVDKETWTRARPVSLTSSVAGHGLQPDEIQDYDEEMVNSKMEIPVPSGAFTVSDGSFYHLGGGKD